MSALSQSMRGIPSGKYHYQQGVRLQQNEMRLRHTQQYYGEHADGLGSAGDKLQEGADDAAEAAGEAAKEKAEREAKEKAEKAVEFGTSSAVQAYQDFLSKITVAFGQRPVDLQNPELYDQLIAVLFPAAVIAWAHKAGIYEIRALDGWVGRPW
jgi:hypothetical protein